MDAELRVRFDNLLHGVGQLLCLDTSRIVQKIGDIINGRYRILHALEIHTRLGVREWNTVSGER